MSDQDGFYTFREGRPEQPETMTSSMEDYLEMICRLLRHSDVVRVSELAEKLHVRPSSASKMVNHLKDAGYLGFQKYGYIVPTEKGRAAGAYLLHRHEVLQTFLCALNHTESELSQVEKIEHFLTPVTVENLENLTRRLRADRPDSGGPGPEEARNPG